MLRHAANQPAGTRWFVLDASAIGYLDSTGAAMLLALREALAERGIRLGIAEVYSTPKQVLKSAGVIHAIGKDMIFEDLADVLPAFERQQSINNHQAQE